MDKDLISWLRHSVTIYNRNGVNEYGEPSYSDGTSAKCLFQQKSKLVVDKAGNTVTSNHRAYFDTNTKIDAEDKVSVDGNEYTVITVEKISDERDTIYYQVAYL